MMESINKNTEVVGVSDALKQLATRKSPPNNAANPPLQKQSPIDEMDNKITINPSSSTDEYAAGQKSDCEKAELDEATQTCGWWNFRPKCLRRFMNPRYALAFLCLAGAIQGNFCVSLCKSDVGCQLDSGETRMMLHHWIMFLIY